jgi:acetoin utilization protein AcuB
MLVKDWMTRNVITIDIDGTMDEAIRLMKENNIRKLPVIKRDRLVGILSDRDIKRASASDATTLDIHELLYLISRIKVKSIMARDPITVPVDFTMEETAELLMKKKISGVPVVDSKGSLVGIITESDIFRALISLTGIGKGGVQFAFRLEDRPGSIKEVTDIIRAHGGRMASILSSYDRAPEGYRNVYIRSFGIDRAGMANLIEALRAKAPLLHLVDHRENRRQIFEEEVTDAKV